MSLSINQVNLAGTLTRDPEIKFTPKGTCVANFSLAINRVWKDDNGAKHEDVTFVECTAFGNTAKTIGDWTKKGHTIFVSGRLKYDTWADKETGNKRSKLSVTVETMNFVSKPKSESGHQDGSQERPSSRESKQPEEGDPSDIPF